MNMQNRLLFQLEISPNTIYPTLISDTHHGLAVGKYCKSLVRIAVYIFPLLDFVKASCHIWKDYPQCRISLGMSSCWLPSELSPLAKCTSDGKVRRSWRRCSACTSLCSSSYALLYILQNVLAEIDSLYCTGDCTEKEHTHMHCPFIEKLIAMCDPERVFGP